MTTSNVALAREEVRTGYPANTLRYDWIMALLGVLSAGGSYLDLWAHTHIPKLETFFTPWHAVLYGSFLLSAGVLAGTAIVNHREGYPWSRSMPRGYGLALLGVFVFAVSGFGDMIWHILFGIEKSVEALLSPTHLGLALGGFLIKTGPLRSGWQRIGAANLRGWRELGPMLLALLGILTGFAFFTVYANSFVDLWAAAKTSGNAEVTSLIQTIGVVSVLLQTALLMGPVLLVIRRWQLPFGALTLVFTLLQAFVSVPGDTYYLLPVALLAGLFADWLLLWLKPSVTRSNEFHLFAFLAPVVLYLLYYLEVALLPGAGISWSIHLWMGSVVLAGVVSLLLSYLLLPPRGIVANDMPVA
ncbi:MAG TPA: hypothetical protein VKR06_03995 [Ktedonosporobacter sp.]|nr:hypothetical protein [Ktedonosporobacter sp.]